MENPDANFMSSSILTLEMLQKDTHKGVGIMKLADMLGIEKAMLPQSVTITTIGICLKQSVCLPVQVRRRHLYIKFVSLRPATAIRVVLQICSSI